MENVMSMVFFVSLVAMGIFSICSILEFFVKKEHCSATRYKLAGSLSGLWLLMTLSISAFSVDAILIIDFLGFSAFYGVMAIFWYRSYKNTRRCEN